MSVDIDSVGDIIGDDGSLLNSPLPIDPIYEPETGPAIFEPEANVSNQETHPTTTGRKQKRFSEIDDSLPKPMRHVRHSERKVREEIYETLADLKGLGLSI